MSAACLAVIALAVSPSAPSQSQGRVPASFEDELVAVVAEPTALAFTASGAMLVASKVGRLFLKPHAGRRRMALVLDLRRRTCTDREQGLAGVAVDPNFERNRLVYVYYTHGRRRGCRGPAVNRLSRFVLSGAKRTVLASERVLLDRIPSPVGIHNGGDVQFGKDGYLYVSVGDGGCHYATRACGPDNMAAREPHVLLGKILRIDRRGRAPSSNGGGARCALAGRTRAGWRCREIYASGLRNPFRMAFDPNARRTRFYVNDVGQHTTEEINVGRRGADYGWPLREGSCPVGGRRRCGRPPNGLTDPLFEYAQRHDRCEAVTGGAFVPRGAWPAPYGGAYLFADYVCGRIRRLERVRGGRLRAREFVTALGLKSAVHLAFTPAGHDAAALYYTTFGGGGEVRRIVHTLGNRRPVARLRLQPTFGRLPLNVRFSAAGSWDDDGDTLEYRWDFGDGHQAVTRKPLIRHRYVAPGPFTARLRVSDGRAVSDFAKATVFAGNQPPAVSITGPLTYGVGERLLLRGAATDPEDGVLPAGRMSWEVSLRHQRHAHPHTPPTSGSALTIVGPVPEDAAAWRTSFLRVTLTATDTQGLSAVAVHDIRPRRWR